ncbi:acyl-CoA synthetase [Novosphingobium fuchskuhlense]|uniref:acyl-CoA synthetase n=1 Tax=Novosphingobium fuchskuhlense TaxID=1117702 RepID=UPI000A5A361D|nr:long-chain fatty acid--CoA ligase [Novosphingobium fuchskuhlense]
MSSKVSLGQALRRAVHLRGAGVAVIDGARSFTWCAFADRVARLAGAFAALGLGEGGRVVLLSLNSHRSLECFFAAIHAGGAITPLNHRLALGELCDQVADARPDVIVLGDDFASYRGDLLAAAGGKAALVHAGEGHAGEGMHSLDALIAETEPLPDRGRGGDDLAILMYTSGTTSAAKGVMLSHANLVANTANTYGELGFGPDIVHLHHGPLFHVAAAARVFSVTHAAGTHVLLPRFVAGEVLAEIARTGVTHATFVPTMLRAMLDDPALASTDLSSLRILSYGSAPMPEALLREVMAALPKVGILQSYGMTELSPVVTILNCRDHLPENHGSGLLRSAGRPVLLSEVAVVDVADRPLPVGEAGEIVARGPNVMLGYWNRPDLTAEVLRGGWMHTGDIGYFDDRGYLYVVDRLKDMIISGGENVYSLEVENVLTAHPAVSQCAVFGRPHDHWGEAVHAVVTLKAGIAATEAELIAHCRAHLAHYKCPRTLEIRDRPMPLSGANKIWKARLREELLSSGH